ncbi:hypothetical protein Tco_1253293 [Tanacetum coccineum]
MKATMAWSVRKELGPRKKEEFEEEEKPQEEEDDMEVDIEKDDNEARGDRHTNPFLREASDWFISGLMRRDISSLFGQMASLSKRLCGRKTAHALVEKKGKAKDDYYNKPILDLGNEVRSSVEEGTGEMENLVRKLGNAEEKAECKKLKKELEEARFSNTLLCIQNERVEGDLYWTRVRAQEFYREMVCRRFVFEERPKLSMFQLKSAPLTQVSVCRMIKESVNAAIAAERARHANARNDARGFLDH